MGAESQSDANGEIARIFGEIGAYLEMQNVPFKPRAYEKVADVLSNLEENVEDIYARGGLKELKEIPGVGVSMAEKIEEYLKTGRVKDHEALQKRMPVNLGELLRVEGLGPKSIKKLYEALGIKDLKDLAAAVAAHRVAALPGFGEKSEEKILKSIEFVNTSGGRFVLGFMMPAVRTIEARLKKLKEVEKITVAGSVRRRKETIGDVDILVIAERPMPVMDYFVNMPEVVRVHAHGETKSAVKLRSGIDVDLRVVPAASYGAALNYFTGSKDHNVALRQIAMKKGYKLNEYGLSKGKKQVAGETEEEIYHALGLDYVEPEMRENSGEIELARAKKLPAIVGYDALVGDLQVQTSWTDGSDSIETMARAAMAQGLRYIAITDHTSRLAMTHGLDERRILKQMAEIDAVNKKLGGKIKILKGSECDILKDGSLDLPDSALAKLDVVGASVHSYFNLSKKEQTARVERAMANPNVDIIFHPTGRIINRRSAYEIDIDEIVKTAKATATVLEIDAYPDRLDLRDEHIRKCVEAGVKMSIDSDAHSPAHFPYLEYGIAQARRGWATRGDIINAWPLDKMLKFLK